MPRRRLLTTVLAAASLLAPSACTDDDRDPTPPSGAETTVPDGDDGTSGEGADAEGSSTSTTLPEGAVEVVLRGDGLGVVELGAGPEPAIDALRAALGPPTRDTGWEPSFSEYGTCPGERIRGVEWDHLVVLFTDGATDHGDGEHLFAWRVSGAPPALGTATGFGYGATAADAEELYPGQVERVPAEEPFPAFLEIGVEGGPVTAYLDEADVVTNLEGGAACGE